jgi:hypothetical protein
MTRALLLSCLLLGAMACHHRASPEVEPDNNAGEVAVRVINHNFADMVVSTEQNGRLSRLGLAHGESSTLFSIPWRRLANSGTLRLLADPVGGSTVIGTEVLSVWSGALVVWTIESSPSQSSAGVY